ncbi:MAG: ABC transporter substrate-binding protein [Candidatus Tectomicrobia bacterium]|nr:ABC transporter substrate-binding protein [Candidatus Tectomicrobia bacterium]
MARDVTESEPEVSRRTLLGAMGKVLTGAALGLVGQAEAGQQPQRGGILRIATRSDAAGLDPHRHLCYPVSVPLAATMQGLLDLNLHAKPVPGVAAEWSASNDLLTYTFKLRRGVQFHNGRSVDASAVRWNFTRMQDARTSHPFIRSALQNLKETEVVDKYTIRFHLHQPSAAFPANVVYYPCSLIAPDSDRQAHRRPIGCGPFRFVRWERNQLTELKRFEHYFETDATGNSLPYLEGMVGRPKHADHVRLMRLRSGQVDLIDTVAYADAGAFPTRYEGRFQTWDVPTLGTSYIVFNLDQGPFTDKRLRQAAAHAIDHDAIKRVVFYGRGETATGFYASASPWHAPGVKPWPAYDPDKAKFLLRQAKAVGTEVVLQSLRTSLYMQQTAALVQEMWSDVGFKVVHKIYDAPILAHQRRTRAFHAESTAASYRFDPDGWFSRQILSTAASTQSASGFRHEKADTLIATARRTADTRKRLELYAEIESLVNEALPILYLHHLTLLEAGMMHLKSYQPAISGPFSTRGAGIRTAWLA